MTRPSSVDLFQIGGCKINMMLLILMILSIQASLVWMNIPAQKNKHWTSWLIWPVIVRDRLGDWSETYKSSSHQKPGGLLLVGPVPYAPAWQGHLDHLLDSALLFREILSSSITKQFLSKRQQSRICGKGKGEKEKGQWSVFTKELSSHYCCSLSWLAWS